MTAICINNSDYPVSLRLGKEYAIIREEGNYYRIIDDSGEDYIFPKECFKLIESEK
jgi:hypothetical protein